jgi:integrase
VTSAAAIAAGTGGQAARRIVMEASTKPSRGDGRPAVGPGDFDQFIDEVLNQLRNETTVNRGTLARYRRAFDTLKGLGVQWRSDLGDDAIVRRYTAAIAHYAQSYRAVLLETFKAIRHHALGQDPGASLMKLSSKPPSRSLSPLPGDVWQLLEHLQGRAQHNWEDQRLYVLVAIVTFVGLRLKEALDLHVQEVDLDAKTIRFQRSSQTAIGFPCPAPITSELAKPLTAWVRQAGSDWLFPGKRRGQMVGHWRHNDAIDQLQEASITSGIPEMSFEALRRFHDQVEALRRFRAEDLEALHRFYARIEKAHCSTARDEVIRPPGWALQPRPSDRDLTVKEAIRLLEWLVGCSARWEGHRLYAFVGTFLFTHLRRMSLTGLRAEHVDLGRSEIRIPGHSAMPLGPEASAILGGWLGRADRGETPFIFPGITLKNAWPAGMKRGHLDRELSDAATWASLGRRVTIDDLRRFRKNRQGMLKLAEAWRSMMLPEPDLKGPPARRGQLTGQPDAWPERATWDRKVRPAVEFKGPERVPLVKDKPKGDLTPSQREPIELLLSAGPEGLTLSEMDAKCNKTGWRQTLIRLKRSDHDWDTAVIFPGRSHGRYRIAPR